MEKWEYLDVYFSNEDWSDSRGRTGKIPKRNRPWQNYTDFVPLLNGLGNDGWELTTSITGDNVYSGRLIFKRNVS